MEKRFAIRKEFFGGIIYDKKNKRNISIDEDVYHLIKSLVKRDFKDIHMSEEELLDLFNTLFEIGAISHNVELIEDIEDIKENRLSAPFRVFYDITYACNLRCKHCFTNSGNKKEDELSLEEKLRLVSEIKRLGTNRISIAGGEPFVSSDLFPFLAHCRGKNIDVSLTTNGVLFTPVIIERINEYGLKNLTVSFDGGTKESMELIRGRGVYEQVLSGLELLKNNYNYNYSIKTTLMKTNIDDIEKIIQTAIRYDCKTVKFNCVREDGRAQNNRNLTILSSEEYVKCVANIEKLKEKYEKLISIKAPLNIFCNEEYDYIEELGFGCFAGKESICINPLGDVKPCSHFPDEFVCGNIRNRSLSDIWNNSNILYEFRNLKGNGKCNSCSQYDMCRAGCRYRAFNNGDINGIDPYCYLEEEMDEQYFG